MTTRYIVIWWMAQTPYIAVMKNKIAAEAAAQARNALMVIVSGTKIKVDAVLDWYRRNEEGKPMPANERDIGQFRGPF